MTFIHLNGQARDPGRDIDIYTPRIEKINDVDDELHFAFEVYKHSSSIAGLGCRGTIVKLVTGCERWTFLIADKELEFNLKMRDYIAPELDDMAFLLYAADGITGAFAEDEFIREPTEFVVVVPAQLLAHVGIPAPGDLPRNDRDELVLSRRHVAGRQNPHRTVGA